MGSGLVMEKGLAPAPFNPVAQKMARDIENIAGGKAMVMAHKSIPGLPTTAHLPKGACIGKYPEKAVIDKNHQVFHYQNMFICGRTAVSAKPGAHPGLPVTALAECAMRRLPEAAEVLKT